MSISKLQNSDLLAQLDEASKMMLDNDLPAEARRAVVIIKKIFADNPEFSKKNKDLYNRYRSYLVIAEFVSLSDLDEDEILDLMENHIQIVLSHEFYDPEEKLREKLLTILDLDKRDEFKSKIRQALLKNKNLITKGKIKVGSVMEPASIANWLKDYYSKLGIDPVDNLKSNQYLVNDVNTKTLKDEDRDKLKKLFSFFEFLKFSSKDKGHLEENFVAILPDGKISIIDGGQPVKIDPEVERMLEDINNNQPQTDSEDDLFLDNERENDVQDWDSESAQVKEVPTSPIASLTESLNKYPPSSLEYKAIKQEIEKLRKQANAK